MKPSAYISEGGVVFKEIPPNLMFTLTPLYTSPEIQYWHNLVKEQDNRIFKLTADLEYANKTHGLRELSEDEIDDVWVETCSAFKLIENGKSKGIINIYDVSRAILKKASGG